MPNRIEMIEAAYDILAQYYPDEGDIKKTIVEIYRACRQVEEKAAVFDRMAA